MGELLHNAVYCRSRYRKGSRRERYYQIPYAKVFRQSAAQALQASPQALQTLYLS